MVSREKYWKQLKEYHGRKAKGAYGQSELSKQGLVRERQYAYDEIIELLNHSESLEAKKLEKLFSWYGKNDPDKLDEFVYLFQTVVGEDGYKTFEQLVYDSGQNVINAYNSIMTDLLYWSSEMFGYSSQEYEDIQQFVNSEII